MEDKEALLALRTNKTRLLDIFRSDPNLIFDKVDEKRLITKREYDILTDISSKDNMEGRLSNLLNRIQSKGLSYGNYFVDLLETDSEIADAFPRLQEIHWNDKCSFGSRKRGVNDPSPAGLDSPVNKKSKEVVTDTTDIDDQYQLTSTPAGLFLIINNKNFEKLSRRNGTENDAGELARTFSWLGYRVLMCEDLKKDQMEETLKSFSSLTSLAEVKESNVKEWSDSGQRFTDLNDLPHHGDAFVCCILTHGKSEGVCGTDGKTIPTRDIIDPFSSSNCPALHTKPKLFFIQACRGGGVQQGVPVNTDGDGENLYDRPSYSLPEFADFLIAFSTIDQYASAREKDGTWYIKTLCKQLKDGCDRGYDIHRILTRVTDEVCKKEGELVGGRQFKQSPDSMNTLRRLLTFRHI